jgi:outer membrane lipoprotein LolB
MLNYKFKLTILFLLISCLYACASLYHQPQTAINQKLSWKTRKQQLQQIKNWQIQGAIAIRTKKQASSASVSWQQKGKQYKINLFGPLGSGAVTISGQPGNSILQTANKQIFKAKTPEQLLKQELGWNVPVSNLYYWIRGLPNPHISAKLKFDKYHHIIEIKQQNWDVKYLSYSATNNLDLPHKTTITNKSLNLRIIINKWEIG